MAVRVRFNTFYCKCFVILLVTEVFIAFFVRDQLVRPFVGDMLVVILIYACVAMLATSPHPRLALWVFLFACSVEIIQYFEWITRMGLEENKLVRIILGATFDWKDLGAYALGALMAQGIESFRRSKAEKQILTLSEKI